MSLQKITLLYRGEPWQSSIIQTDSVMLQYIGQDNRLRALNVLLDHYLSGEGDQDGYSLPSTGLSPREWIKLRGLITQEMRSSLIEQSYDLCRNNIESRERIALFFGMSVNLLEDLYADVNRLPADNSLSCWNRVIDCFMIDRRSSFPDPCSASQLTRGSHNILMQYLCDAGLAVDTREAHLQAYLDDEIDSDTFVAGFFSDADSSGDDIGEIYREYGDLFSFMSSVELSPMLMVGLALMACRSYHQSFCYFSP